jgi:hypothetical protein
VLIFQVNEFVLVVVSLLGHRTNIDLERLKQIRLVLLYPTLRLKLELLHLVLNHFVVVPDLLLYTVLR